MWKMITFFARFYTPFRFVEFLRRTKGKIHFVPRLLAIYYCLRDTDTPKAVKLVLMGALGHVILPFDIVPDIFPAVGWLDDAAVIAAALKFAGAYIKPEHLEKVRHVIPFAKCDW